MTENTGTSTAPEPKGQILSIQISEVKPWVAIAVLLAVAILGIYAIQSYRGWSSWQRTESLTARIGNLTVILSKDEPPLADIANRLETDQRKLEELRQKFEYVSVDSSQEAFFPGGECLAQCKVFAPAIGQWQRPG